MLELSILADPGGSASELWVWWLLAVPVGVDLTAVTFPRTPCAVLSPVSELFL